METTTKIMGLVTVFDAIEGYCRLNCQGARCDNPECALYYWSPGRRGEADLSWYRELQQRRAKNIRDRERRAANG